MQQFDICPLVSERRAKGRPDLVIVLQHRHSLDLHTCVVAPLRPEKELPAVGLLRPSVAVGARKLRLIVDRLNVVRRRDLADPIGTAIAHEYEIKRAIDQLFLGV